MMRQDEERHGYLDTQRIRRVASKMQRSHEVAAASYAHVRHSSLFPVNELLMKIKSTLKEVASSFLAILRT